MKYYSHVDRQLAGNEGHPGGVSLLPRALLLGALLPLWIMLLSIAPVWAMPEEGGGEPDINGVKSGQLLFHNQAGGSVTAAVIQASKVHFDISGMIATVTLQQSFRNDTDHWLEGVYAFPLPDNAAVRYLEIVIGERRIVGKIREKSEAKKIYQAAKKAGKRASLVEQQRPNLFTNRIANIGPGEEITVHMEYVQEVSFSADTFSVRFPTTITPRYRPGADAISPMLNPVQGSAFKPLNPVEITAQLDMGMPLARVESPYHDVALSRRAGVYTIRLVNGVSEMDRDFVLSWRPVTGTTPAAALFTQEVGGEHFGLLMVVPPAASRAAAPIAREIVFVVDTSGSMGGVAIEQARASVSSALQRLRPEDRFNIIEFNATHSTLYRRPMPATRHHVQKAQAFVRTLHASGGTEMLPALQAALAPPGAADEYREPALLRQVIFITDGAVGNEAALFEEISARLGSTRLFTVGIGSAPNSWFMRKAAQFGRGTHTSIGDLNEVGQKMAALFDQLAHPVAVNLTVDWPTAVEAWPARAPDLYQGQPLLLTVNFGSTAPQGEVTVSGEINAQAWSRRLQLVSIVDPAIEANPAIETGHKGIATLWARHKIAELLDQKFAGRDEGAVRAEVLPVALQHQLLSPYTSFVAVQEMISRPPGMILDRQSVANAAPRGQSPQGYAYPRTATTGPAKAWFGGLLLFLGVILRVLRQTEVDHEPVAQPD